MSQRSYRTAPLAISTMPPGIPFIVGNEAAERFSFYGMRTILFAYMTGHLVNSAGMSATMSDAEAASVYHGFVAAAYFFPFVGALAADVFLGKYRTIIYFSLVYCLGHLVLALIDSDLWRQVAEPRTGLVWGLFLIAMGAGCIKGCVSAHVGDQFGKTNQHLLEKVFGWFYLSINVGSVVSTWLTPILLTRYGPEIAFAVPGVLMAIATLVFWLGRHRYAHVPPGGWKFVRESMSADGLKAAGGLLVLYVFVAMFWCLFDQTGSRWVEQAGSMNRAVDLAWLGGWGLPESLRSLQIEPSQMQAANPFLILVLIPIFSYVVYPLVDKFIRVTPLRKIGLGLFLTAASFAVCALVQVRIDRGETPHILWQFVAYLILTSAEILVSVTGLEFSYTQAPVKMKSLIMALWFLAITLGNEFAHWVNHLIEAGTIELQGANYYWFFTGAMAIAAVAFVLVAPFYQAKTYVQEEQPSKVASAG
jgi:POT family proton-dependent oligopeptide transporter